MAEKYPDLKGRPIKETICLFDVDGTLTPARQRVSPEMLKLLSELRHKCAIGFVGYPTCSPFHPIESIACFPAQYLSNDLFLEMYFWRSFVSYSLCLVLEGNIDLPMKCSAHV